MSKQQVVKSVAERLQSNEKSEDKENSSQNIQRRILQEVNGPQVLTGSFSVRNPIKKQPLLEYEQTCIICGNSFPNCRNMMLKNKKETYFAEHLRECMLNCSDEDLKKIKLKSSEEKTAIFRSVLQRRTRYINMHKISVQEINGLNRVLRIAFDKLPKRLSANPKRNSAKVLKRKIKPAYKTAKQEEVNKFFEKSLK